MELGNTSLTLQWQVQGDRLVKVTIPQGHTIIPGSMSVLARFTTAASWGRVATFQVPFKKEISGGTGLEKFRIELTEEMFDINRTCGYIDKSFTANINLMFFEKKPSKTRGDVVEEAKANHQKDFAATEMLKELHIRLSDPSTADCTIICRGKRLPSHKYILSMRSKVFEVKQIIH